MHACVAGLIWITVHSQSPHLFFLHIQKNQGTSLNNPWLLLLILIPCRAQKTLLLLLTSVQRPALPQDLGVIRADDPGGSNTFSEEEEPRRCFMPFKSRRMRTGEQVGLGALTQLPFLHSACLVLPFTGLWKHTSHFLFSFFATPPTPVKERLGNEWGSFPQRGPGNVKTDFLMTPLEVAGCFFSLCFNVAGLTRQLG